MSNLIKTYTPSIPAGVGPTCTNPEDCITEILHDLSEVSHIYLNSTEMDVFVNVLVKGLNIDEWEEGIYDLFPGYSIEIRTMAEEEYNNLPEFNGY